jgi:FixJ family two-component response regulator
MKKFIVNPVFRYHWLHENLLINCKRLKKVLQTHNKNLAHFLHILLNMKNTHDTTDNKTILLFEEEEQLRRSISFTLKCRGYNVAAYGEIGNLLGIIENKVKSHENVVLVITDLQLPGRSAYYILKTLYLADYRIPILVITGHGNREVRTELAKLGITDIIDSPFSVEELVTKVELIIKNFQRG